MPSNGDPSAIHWSHADEFKNAAEKSTPIGDDEILLEDSEDSKKKKRAKLSSLPGGASALDDLSDVDTSGVQDGDALLYDGDTNTWVPGEGSGGGGASYHEIVGDSSETTFSIEHNLDTTAVVVGVVELSSGDGLVNGTDFTWSVVDENEISVTFASAPDTDDALIVVLASGGTSGGGGGGVFEGIMVPSGGDPSYIIPGVTVMEMSTASFGDANLLRYCPFYVVESIDVDHMAAIVTSGNGSGRLARIGIYEADIYGQPTTLVAEGEIDCSSTGLKTVAVNKTLPPGRYLTACHVNHGSVQFRYAGVATGNRIAGTGAGVFNTMQVTKTYAALSNPGTAWDAANLGSGGIRGYVWLGLDL